MSKRIELSGMCAKAYGTDGHIYYQLVQPDGYKIDLVARVAEIADFMGGKMAASWWIGDTPKTKDQLVEGFLGRVYGDVESRNWSEEYYYSSYTHGSYEYEECKVGGHSLLEGFEDGKFILFEFTDGLGE